MKIILMLAFVFFVSGCSLLTQAPSEAKARRLEEDRGTQERDMAINGRANEHEKKGLSSRDAKAAAETEHAKSGAR